MDSEKDTSNNTGESPVIVGLNGGDEESVYTAKEEETLDFIMDLHVKSIKSFTNDGKDLPATPGSLRVINEAANSLVSNINQNASMRLKGKSNKDGEELAASIIAQAMRNIDAESKQNKINKATSNERSLDLPDDIIDVEFVPGELSTEPEEIELVTIMGEEED